MTPPLETPRLFLVPVTLADAEQIQRIFPQWEIVKYLGIVVPWPYPPDGALTFLCDQLLPGIERGDRWGWTLRLKSAPDEIIGSITLQRDKENNRGFWIARPYQGRGLMTEAAAAVTRFWFEELQRPVLCIKKARDNAASRAISLRQGMRCISQAEDDFVSGRLPTEIWELTAEEWRRISR